MKKRRVQSNRSVYAVLGLLNACLVVALAAILAPSPEPVVVANSMSDTARIRPDVPTIRLAKQGVPTRVVVPSVSIDLGVQPGSYEPEKQTWTLNDYSAFYADRTVPANNSNGTTLLYGHGTSAVFARITNIQQGAEATVYTDTGLIFSYRFESSREVLPTDTSVLNESGGAPKLVLQTCSGPFDKYRTLVSFVLVGVTGYE